MKPTFEVYGLDMSGDIQYLPYNVVIQKRLEGAEKIANILADKMGETNLTYEELCLVQEAWKYQRKAIAAEEFRIDEMKKRK
jgi:hypothetical protein